MSRQLGTLRVQCDSGDKLDSAPAETVTRGQGTPLLTALLKRNWGTTIMDIIPAVNIAAYVDDRDYWCKTDNPVQDIKRALDITGATDAVLGWSTNATKTETASNNDDDRRRFDEVFPTTRGCGTTVATLGIQHVVTDTIGRPPLRSPKRTKPNVGFRVTGNSGSGASEGPPT